MSVINNSNLMTSSQLKRKIESVDTKNIDIKQDLLRFVEQFQYLDHVAASIGLVKDLFSFANKISWDDILSKLASSNEVSSSEIEFDQIREAVTQSTSMLENELVPKVQSLRNNWMLKVILFDFFILSSLIFVIAGLTYMQDLWGLSNLSFSVQTLLYERPIFSLTILMLGFIGFFWLHFKVRIFVARQLIKKLSCKKSEFDFAEAFLKNTRIWHSIFRPDIIGWNGLTKNKLLKENE